MALDDLGDLVFQVGGDISAFEEACNELPGIAAKAASAVEDAFDAHMAETDGMTASVKNLAEGVTAAGQAAAQAVGGLDAMVSAASAASAPIDAMANSMNSVNQEFIAQQQTLANAQDNLRNVVQAYQQGAASMGQVQVAAQQLGSAFDALNGTQQTLLQTLAQAQQNLANATQAYQAGAAGMGQVQTAAQQLQQAYAALNGTTQQTATANQGLAQSLAAVAAGLAFVAGIKTFAEDALDAYSQVQRLQLSLQLLTGSLDDAAGVLTRVQQIAETQPFAFPELAAAAQKLAAFGVDASQIPGLLQTAADAAAATGNSFNTVASTLARVAETGQVTARQFVQLGVSMQDVADYLGVSLQQATADLKKGVLDAQTAVDLLAATVNDKFGGAAGTMAATIGAQFAILQNQIHEVVISVGADLAPFAQKFIDVAESILPAIREIIADFQALPEPVQAAIVTLGELAIAIPIVAIAVGGLTAAMGALTAVGWPVVAVAGAIGLGFAAVNFPQVREWFSDLWNDAKNLYDVLQPMAKAIGDAGSALADFVGVSGLAKDTIDALGVSLKYVWDVMVGLPKDAPSASAALQNLSGNVLAMQQGLMAVNELLAPSYDLVAQHATEAGEAQSRAALQAKVAGEAAAAAAAQAQKAIDKWNDSWDQTAEKAIDAFEKVSSGAAPASSAISMVSSAIESASLNSEKMSTDSKALLGILTTVLGLLQGISATEENNTALDKLTDSVGKLLVASNDLANKVPGDMAAMSDAVTENFAKAQEAAANGVNFSSLDTKIKDEINKLKTELQSLGPADMANLGAALQDQIANLTAAEMRAKDYANVLKLIGADQGMVQLSQQISSLVAVQASGTLSAAAFNAALGNIFATIQTKIIPAMESGVTIAPQLTAALGTIPGVGPAIVAALNSGATAVDNFKNVVSNDQLAIKAAALSMDQAFANLGVTGIAKAQAAMNDASVNIVASLKNVDSSVQLSVPQWDQYANAILNWAQKALPAIQNGATVSQSVIDAIAKISPAFADAINKGPDAFAAAVATMKEQVTANMTTVAASYQAAGAVMQSTLQDTLALQQKQLDVLIASNAPMQVQLQMAQKILATQLASAQATDQSGISEAALAVKITEVQLATYAAHQQTMGLADAWTNLAKGVAGAWNDMEKGLAQAIVAGKGFGDVMTKMLTDIELVIVEVAVKFIIGQLVSSLLTSLGFSGSLIASLGVLGTASAATSATVAASMTAAATAMTTASTAMAASATALGAATTAGMGAAAASTTAAASTIVPATAAISASMVALATVVGAFGAVVGAIAGVIGDIEQAHTNTLLTRIELSTRETWQVIGGNGTDTIFWFSQMTGQKMSALVDDIMWGVVIPLLTDISGSLDTIAYDTDAMRTSMLAAAANGTQSMSTAATTMSASVATFDQSVSTFSQSLAALSQAITPVGNPTEASGQSYNVATDQPDFSGITSQLPTASTFQGYSPAVDPNAVSNTLAMFQAQQIAAQTPTPVAPSGGVGSDLGGVSITPAQPYVFSNPSGVASTPSGAGSSSADQTQPWVSVPITVQGNVYGANGMNQLAETVGNIIVTKLRGKVSLIKS